MASLLLRRKKFWVQFFVPGQSAPRRLSLGTGDPAAATLIKEKMEHLLALSEPRLLGVEIPAAISLTLPAVGVAPAASRSPVETKGVPLSEALAAYHLHSKESNHPRWVSLKLKVLSALFSSDFVARVTKVDLGRCAPEKGLFRGKHLEEISSIQLEALVSSRKGRDGKSPASEKTKRHYREVLHDFFEYCLSHGLMLVKNFHTPDGRLPSGEATFPLFCCLAAARQGRGNPPAPHAHICHWKSKDTRCRTQISLTKSLLASSYIRVRAAERLR